MTNKYVPTLPPLHKGQLEVAQSDARWKILCAGRRFGKTRLGVQMCMVFQIVDDFRIFASIFRDVVFSHV